MTGRGRAAPRMRVFPSSTCVNTAVVAGSPLKREFSWCSLLAVAGSPQFPLSMCVNTAVVADHPLKRVFPLVHVLTQL
ncbi:hypothetical protein RRG08_055810 [Elysia crispata]|uniref:Uncharacterized protein n=1 Tax=Elysia crispata TaxID=231223 RepID=A0AAE1EA98_9GAST|nr:hypothetical protein RRG08_055810 [Elysia crispata]